MSNEKHKKMGRSGICLALIRSKYKNQEEVLLGRKRLPVMSSRKDKEEASWQDAQEVERAAWEKIEAKIIFLDTSKKENKKMKCIYCIITFFRICTFHER